MKKTLGYLLMGLVFFLNWILQIGLGIYGIYYIVKTFLNAGIVAGLICIFVVAFVLWVVHMIIGLISIPFVGLIASLLEEKTPKPEGGYLEIPEASRGPWEEADCKERGEHKTI